jgi:hypothetical protein
MVAYSSKITFALIPLASLFHFSLPPTLPSLPYPITITSVAGHGKSGDIFRGIGGTPPIPVIIKLSRPLEQQTSYDIEREGEIYQQYLRDWEGAGIAGCFTGVFAIQADRGLGR